MIISVLFFKLMLLIYVKAGRHTEPQSPAILPLIMIRLNNENMTRPDHIAKSNINEIGNFMTGTQFQAWLLGSQAFFCGKNPSKDQNSATKNNPPEEEKYCSYSMDFKPKQQLRCEVQPQLFVQRVKYINEDTDIRENKHCGPNLQGEMYRFAYKACFTESKWWFGFGGKIVTERSIMEVYKFCYLRAKNKTLYTEHIIMSPLLLADDSLKHEREYQQEMMVDGYDIFGSRLQSIEQAYTELKKQNEILRDESLDSSINSFLQPQMLVPSDDMALASWKKATFHYLNIEPMREEQKKLWDYLSRLIREDAIKNKKQYRIITSAIDILPNKNRQFVDSIVTPDIWIKVIRHISRTIESMIVILNNNLQDDAFEDLFNGSTCEKNLCQVALYDEFPKMRKSVRCCPARGNPILDQLDLRHNFESDYYLKIPSFAMPLVQRKKYGSLETESLLTLHTL